MPLHIATHGRRRARALVACACAAAVFGCGREPTGADHAAVRAVSITAFNAEFPRALQTLGISASTLVPFTRVRLLLSHADGTAALDSSFEFAPGVDSLPLSLNVKLSPVAPASGEPLQLVLAYVNADRDTVFRGGPVTVLARIQQGDGTPAGDAVRIPVQYSGPGARAVSVRLSPRSLSVLAGDVFAFQAQAFDATGAEVVGTPVVYRSLDPVRAALTRFTSGAGLASGSRGTVAIVADLLNGAADTAQLIVMPRAHRVQVISGGGQSAETGTVLPQPIVARVVDASGDAVPGATVQFTPAAGEITTPPGVTTDGDGYARTTWQLGNKPGAQSLTVSAGDLLGSPFDISATATVGKPAADTTKGGSGGAADLSKAVMLIVSGNDQSARQGTTLALPLVVRVSDAAGNAIADVSVEWKTSGPDGAALAATTATDAKGLASNKWTLGARVGAQSVNVSLVHAGGGVSFTATALPDASTPPGRLAFLIGPSDVPLGVAITPAVVVEALDALGKHDSTFTGRVSVELRPTTAGARLAGHQTVTAVAGLAVFDQLKFDAADTGLTLVATATGLASATSGTFIVTNPATQMKASGGDKQQAKPGATLSKPLVVSVDDSRGRPMAGVTVKWRVTSGGGVVTAQSTTDSKGQASATWTLGAVAGAQGATASVDGLIGSPVIFTATAKP